jgi:hypothetical protein
VIGTRFCASATRPDVGNVALERRPVPDPPPISQCDPVKTSTPESRYHPVILSERGAIRVSPGHCSIVTPVMYTHYTVGSRENKQIEDVPVAPDSMFLVQVIHATSTNGLIRTTPKGIVCSRHSVYGLYGQNLVKVPASCAPGILPLAQSHTCSCGHTRNLGRTDDCPSWR